MGKFIRDTNRLFIKANYQRQAMEQRYIRIYIYVCIHTFFKTKLEYKQCNSLERSSMILDFGSKKSSTEESTWSYLVE